MRLGPDPEGRPFCTAAARVTLAVAAAFSVVVCCTAGVAGAHGGGPGLTYDPCMQRTGGDEFIHMAAYQPEFNPFAEYCEALPKAGSTLLVFDLMGSGLPDTPVSLEIVEKGARFQRFVPPRRYRSGVIDFRVDLEPGKYRMLVNVDGPDGRRRLA